MKINEIVNEERLDEILPALATGASALARGAAAVGRGISSAASAIEKGGFAAMDAAGRAGRATARAAKAAKQKAGEVGKKVAASPTGVVAGTVAGWGKKGLKAALPSEVDMPDELRWAGYGGEDFKGWRGAGRALKLGAELGLTGRIDQRRQRKKGAGEAPEASPATSAAAEYTPSVSYGNVQAGKKYRRSADGKWTVDGMMITDPRTIADLDSGASQSGS